MPAVMENTLNFPSRKLRSCKVKGPSMPSPSSNRSRRSSSRRSSSAAPASSMKQEGPGSALISEIDLSSYGTPSSVLGTPRSSAAGGMRGTPVRLRSNIQSECRLSHVSVATPQDSSEIMTPSRATVSSHSSVNTPTLFRRDTSAFSAAKNALSTALPDELIGRQNEMATMEKFLANAWKAGVNSSKSLYVSGAPGTGKTACLSHLIEKRGFKSSHEVIFLNCMSLRTSQQVFVDVARALDPSFEGSNAQARKHVEAKICKTTKKSKPLLLVLDEMDQLGSKDQDVLYTLFELPHLKGSRLALVGIANELDLTDRTLPRLKAAVACAPQQLAFPAYTRSEIHDIIASRLKTACDGDDDNLIIKPAAVKYLAGKISSLSGDIRKALDVCRRAIELAEIEYRKQTVLTDTNTDKPKQIDIAQILKIFNEVYSSRVTASLNEAQSDLPLQQKLLLATLLLMSCYGKRKCKEVSLGKLHESHTRVCRKRSINGLDLSEVNSLCSLLETRGLFFLRKGKSIREVKVSLRIDEEEVEQALQDKTLLTGILRDTACIAK